MTERTEVRFNVYNKTNDNVAGGNILPFDVIDFNVGGSYDTSTHKYTFQYGGTYLIGESHIKNANGNNNTLDLVLEKMELQEL